MRVRFRNFRLARVCANERELARQYGPKVARKIRLHLEYLQAAVTLADMRGLPGGCHELKGDRRGHLAVTLHGGFRLIFRPLVSEVPKPDTGLNWSSVTEVVVTEIVDYH